MWLGTTTGKLLHYDRLLKDYVSISLPYNSTNLPLTNLYIDSEANLWMLNGSSQLWNANLLFQFFEINDGTVQAVLSTKAGYWVGSKSGLTFYDKGTKAGQGERGHLPKASKQILKVDILSLHEDCFGNVYAGTGAEGIYVFDVFGNRKMHLQEEDGLSDNGVQNISSNKLGLWIALQKGVMRIPFTLAGELNMGLAQYINQEQNLPIGPISQLLCDQQGRAWFASIGYGIGYIDSRLKVVLLQTGQAALLKKVLCMEFDLTGRLWVFDTQNGLFSVEGEKVELFDSHALVKNRTVRGIKCAANGVLVLTMPKSLVLLNPSIRHLHQFGAQNGIVDFDPSINALCLDPLRGDIVIGGKNGHLINYHAGLNHVAIHPAIVIRWLETSLGKQAPADAISLPYEANSVSIAFSGLWYTAPDRVSYRYRLLGYEDIYKESREPSVRYTRLAPGRYVFEVMSRENLDWSDEPIARMIIHIDYPIWQKWWFVLGFLIAGVIIVRWYIIQRDARLSRLTQLEVANVKSELGAIKSQINPHFLFNSFNTLMSLIESDTKKAKDYLSYLSDFYRSTMSYRDQDVVSIAEELIVLDYYIYLLSIRFGPNLQIEIDIADKSRAIIPLTLQMLVENAVKHNVANKLNPLVIRIEQKNNYLFVTSKIQRKANTEGSTNFGLETLKRRYELMAKKTIKVTEIDGIWTVQVPFL